MLNFNIFELKDIIALLQKYNLEIQKPGYTLYGKYNGIALFKGTVSGKADDKILNIQMAYDLSIYNGEITYTGNYYPITLETIEFKLQSLVEEYKLLEVALKKRAIEKDFKMTEDVKISKIIELANKYNLKVEKYKFNYKISLKMSCGLLVATVEYTSFDYVVNIEIPREYITGFLSDEGHRFILCQGWMQVQGLFSFERKVKFLLENFKRCEVECRKLELENDFK